MPTKESTILCAITFAVGLLALFVGSNHIDTNGQITEVGHNVASIGFVLMIVAFIILFAPEIASRLGLR